MKQILHISLVLLWCLQLQAQNYTTREHNFMTPLVYNPAVAGTEDELVAVLSAKRSWIGIKNGPGVNMLQAHVKASELGFSKPRKYISNRSALMGLGLGISSDRNGPLSNNTIQLTYAYHIVLSSKTLLSFGLAAKLSQYTLDETVFKPTDADDPNITFNKQSTFIPNFNAGVFLRHKNYYAGLSTTNLAGIKRNATNFFREENLRTLYLTGGYTFKLGNSKTLETNLLARYFNNKIWLDVTARYHYRKFLWYGIGYATPNVLSVFGAVHIKKMDIGYVYEYYNSPLYTYSRGNHMIFIAYNLCRD